MDEFDTLLAERLRPITIIDYRTGKVSTPEREHAQRQIAFGAAAETIPADPKLLDKWLADLRGRVEADLRAKYDGKSSGRQDGFDEIMAALHDYEAWCAENGCRALPADEKTVVRYLLSRVSSGELEQHHASRRAYLLGKVQEVANHPPRHLGELSYNAFNRAVGFARSKLRTEVKNIYDVEAMTPKRALEMFPDGVVPMRWADIAA